MCASYVYKASITLYTYQYNLSENISKNSTTNATSNFALLSKKKKPVAKKIRLPIRLLLILCI